MEAVSDGQMLDIFLQEDSLNVEYERNKGIRLTPSFGDLSSWKDSIDIKQQEKGCRWNSFGKMEEQEFNLARVSLRCLLAIQLEMSSRLLNMSLEFCREQALEI